MRIRAGFKTRQRARCRCWQPLWPPDGGHAPPRAAQAAVDWADLAALRSTGEALPEAAQDVIPEQIAQRAASIARAFLQAERQREPRDALLWEHRPLGAGGDSVLEGVGDAALRALVAAHRATPAAATATLPRSTLQAPAAAEAPQAVVVGPLAAHLEQRLAATERQRLGYVLRVPFCDAMLEGADGDAVGPIEVRIMLA